MGFPGGASSTEFACQGRYVRDVGWIPGLGRSSEGGHGNPCQYSFFFLSFLGESENAVHSNILALRIHGQRSLAGSSPQGRVELDTTEES